MSTTQHPLSEAAAAVLVTKFAPGVAFQMLTSVSPDDLTAYGRLAFDAGREYERATTPPAVEVEMPTEFGAVILDPIWSTRGYTRAVHLGEGVWAAEITPGADVRTYLLRDLTSATRPDGTRVRRVGERADGAPRFVKVQVGEK